MRDERPVWQLPAHVRRDPVGRDRGSPVLLCRQRRVPIFLEPLERANHYLRLELARLACQAGSRLEWGKRKALLKQERSGVNSFVNHMNGHTAASLASSIAQGKVRAPGYFGSSVNIDASFHAVKEVGGKQVGESRGENQAAGNLLSN